MPSAIRFSSLRSPKRIALGGSGFRPSLRSAQTKDKEILLSTPSSLITVNVSVPLIRSPIRFDGLVVPVSVTKSGNGFSASQQTPG